LFPDVLLNSSTSFGDANLQYRTCSISAPTNVVPSTGVSGCDAGEKSELIDGDLSSGGRRFMCRQDGDRSDSRSDADAPTCSGPLPDTAAGSNSGSMTSSGLPCTGAPSPSGSSVAPIDSLLPSSDRVATHGDPVDGGTSAPVFDVAF